MTGVEWVIDARGCDAARLTDKSILAELFDGIIRDLSLNVVGEPMWHVFPGAGGITGLCLLSESHLRRSHVPRARLALSQRVLLSSARRVGR
jgi:S-adenosylmethionine decarboxylase